MRWIALLLLSCSALCGENLVVGDTVSSTIAAGASQEYALPHDSGNYFELQVESNGTRIEIGVAGISRKMSSAEMLPSTLCWIADESTPATLRVQSLERNGARVYKLRLTSRVASPLDQARARGCALVEQALIAPKPAMRVEKYQAALNEFAAAGDRANQATTLTSMGVTLWDLGKTTESLATHEKAVQMWEGVDSPRRRAAAVYRWSLALLLLNQQQKAKEQLRLTAKLAHEAGDPSLEASALTDLALQISREGGYDEAVTMSARAIALQREAGDRKGEGDSQNMRGMIQQNAGLLDDALARYSRALELRKELSDETGQAQVLNNLATVHNQLGEIPTGIALLEQALEIRKRIAGPQAVANTQHNLGVQYVLKGEFDRAMQMFDEALPVWRSTKSALGEAATLTEQGQLFFRIGLFDRAERAYRESLEIQKTLANRRGEATSLLGIGNTLTRTGRYPEAEKLFQSALGITREGKFPQERARALQALGRVHSQMGQHEAALAELREAADPVQTPNRLDRLATRNTLAWALERASQADAAMRTYREVAADAQSLESRVEEYNARAGLARLLAASGDLRNARIEISKSVDLVEDQRTKVASPDLRAEYLGRSRDIYRIATDILMRAGDTQAAFAVSERGRARALLDLLTTSATENTTSIGLLAEEKTLRLRLNAKADRLTRLLARDGKPPEVAPLRKEIAALLDAHTSLKERIAREDPRLTSQAVPAVAEEIQKHLAPGETMLEFSLGQERSYAWMLTRDSLAALQLPARTQIEETAAKLRDNLDAALDSPANETSDERRTRLASARAAVQREERDLNTMLLLRGASRSKKLYVIPDGGLQYIPFALLSAFRQADVVTLPSAAVLAKLPPGARYSGSVAVFADPVYERTDARFSDTRTETISQLRPGLRAVEEPLRFPRLRFSQQEADAIAALPASPSHLVFTGFHASRAEALKTRWQQFGVVHFATHAVLNERQPELSGIVLSLYDANGKPTDGFIRLSDIAQLPLNSQLIVLSACQTALGKRVDGEGLIGLTRAFLAAGAAGVIATLWEVDDAATAYLMKEFYEALLRKGQTPAVALHTAQQAVRSQGKWSDPYYWAGFIYSGR